MIRKIVTIKLWDYEVRFTTQVIQINYTQSGGLRGILPLKYFTEETPDILEYLDLGLYNHVSYKENSGLGTTAIGRWLGVSHRVNGLMFYWILTQKGTVISRTKFQRLNSLDEDTD